MNNLEWESAPTTEHTAPNHPFYSLEYYMNFFDVDTSQVWILHLKSIELSNEKKKKMFRYLIVV